MSAESAENDAPVRPCCGQRHHGPVCPDGLVMCCICFNRVPKDRLALLDDGDGATSESAPIYEDVCRTCRRREEQWGGRVSSSRKSEEEEPTCVCGHAAIDHHGADPADGCLGIASHRLPQCPCRLTHSEVLDVTR